MSTPSIHSLEWRQLCTDRLLEVSEKLREKDIEANQLRCQLVDLETDFIFNLGLIKERDEELDRLESNLSCVQRELDLQGDALFEASERLIDVQKVASQLSQELHETQSKLNISQEITRKIEVERISWINEKQKFEREVSETNIKITKIEKIHQVEVAQLKHTQEILENQLVYSKKEFNLQKEEIKTLRLKIDELSNSKSMNTTKNNEIFIEQTPEIEKLYKQLEEAYYEIEHYRSEVEILKSQNLVYSKKEFNLQKEEIKTLRLKIDELSNSKSMNTTKNNEIFIEQTPEIEKLYKQLEEAYYEIEHYRSEVEILKSQNNENQGEDDSTVTELNRLKEQNLILREVIKDLKRRLNENMESCSQCSILKKDLDKQKQIQEKCSARNIQQNERLKHLEDIMEQLKMKMLQDLQGKNLKSNSSKDLNTSFGDVRFMILEEKLERATKTIGTSMQAETKNIMDEINKIRKEIVAKNDSSLNKPNVSDEMIADVQNEMNLLENKVSVLFSSMNNQNDCSTTSSSITSEFSNKAINDINK